MRERQQLDGALSGFTRLLRELDDNIDGLLQAPNARRSTPVDRCKEPGASGYNYRGNKTRARL